MLTLGIDPGTIHLGWGLVSREGNRLTHVAHGVINLDSDEPLAKRLKRMEVALVDIVEQHRPLVGSVESLFFHRDAQAAVKLGHARGVVLLILERAGVKIAEYAPARVKRTIVGNGQADKRQVAMMVRAALSLDGLPPADASDALALAITHLRAAPSLQDLTFRPKSTGSARSRTRQAQALAQLVATRRRR